MQYIGSSEARLASARSVVRAIFKAADNATLHRLAEVCVAWRAEAKREKFRRVSLYISRTDAMGIPCTYASDVCYAFLRHCSLLSWDRVLSAMDDGSAVVRLLLLRQAAEPTIHHALVVLHMIAYAGHSRAHDVGSDNTREAHARSVLVELRLMHVVAQLLDAVPGMDPALLVQDLLLLDRRAAACQFAEHRDQENRYVFLRRALDIALATLDEDDLEACAHETYKRTSDPECHTVFAAQLAQCLALLREPSPLGSAAALSAVVTIMANLSVDVAWHTTGETDAWFNDLLSTSRDLCAGPFWTGRVQAAVHRALLHGQVFSATTMIDLIVMFGAPPGAFDHCQTMLFAERLLTQLVGQERFECGLNRLAAHWPLAYHAVLVREAARLHGEDTEEDEECD